MGAGFNEEDSRRVEVLICLFPRSRAWHSLFLACLQGVPGEMPPLGSTLCYLPPSTKGKDRLGRPPLLDNSTSGQPQSSSKQHMEVCPTGADPVTPFQAPPHPRMEITTLETPWGCRGHWETEEELYLLSRED